MKLSAAALLFLAAGAQAGGLSYPVRKKTLPNGLDVVVIETPEFKDVLSYNTIILAGSGKEEEKGTTGFAHLFEHILFRHRIGGVEGGYDDTMNRLGTHNNAWTNFDVTFYHPLTFAQNLGKLAELEAGRFSRLDISEKTFKTESGAVLGEYRKDASQPTMKMEDRLFALMFPGHPYGHNTMGYYEDVVDMPNHFETARKFYDTYYRPNNCAVVIAGDVKADAVFKTVEPYYKDWRPKPVPPVQTKGEAPKKEQKEAVTWDADIAPQVWVAYRMPAFSPKSRESAAAELLNELLVAPAAPLYKKLRYEKQSASAVGFEEGPQGFESADPRLLTVTATLYKEQFAAKGTAYFDEVSSDVVTGLDALKDFSKQEGAAELLKTVKSKYRYDFMAQLSSPESITATFAWYYRFTRDPKVLDALLESVEAVKAEDIDRLARTYFTAENRVLLTLAYKPAGGKGQ